MRKRMATRSYTRECQKGILVCCAVLESVLALWAWSLVGTRLEALLGVAMGQCDGCIVGEIAVW